MDNFNVELGHYLMDISKYILSGVVITALFQYFGKDVADNHSKLFWIVFSGSILAITLVIIARIYLTK